MRASRIQGTVCTQRWNIDVLDGTSCRWAMGHGTNDPFGLPYLYPDTETVIPAEVVPIPPPELGSLSAKHESNGNPGAIGWDSTGGWSYGTYQIATTTTSPKEAPPFPSFIMYLTQVHPDLAKPLHAAGGHKAAHNGTQQFRRAWVGLAKKRVFAFTRAQHDFIKMTHYDVQSFFLKEVYALDVDQRSNALRNVVWSIAVQHGNRYAPRLFSAVLDAQPKGTKAADWADADLIHLLYAERSRVEIYFRNSNEKVKKGLKKRFVEEEKEALKMLRAEGAGTVKGSVGH